MVITKEREEEIRKVINTGDCEWCSFNEDLLALLDVERAAHEETCFRLECLHESYQEEVSLRDAWRAAYWEFHDILKAICAKHPDDCEHVHNAWAALAKKPPGERP